MRGFHRTCVFNLQQQQQLNIKKTCNAPDWYIMMVFFAFTYPVLYCHVNAQRENTSKNCNLWNILIKPVFIYMCGEAFWYRVYIRRYTQSVLSHVFIVMVVHFVELWQSDCCVCLSRICLIRSITDFYTNSTEIASAGGVRATQRRLPHEFIKLKYFLDEMNKTKFFQINLRLLLLPYKNI